jgi:hypothetical protein
MLEADIRIVQQSTVPTLRSMALTRLALHIEAEYPRSVLTDQMKVALLKAFEYPKVPLKKYNIFLDGQILKETTQIETCSN